MTQLYLNGMEVAISAELSITLTEENPYFTAAGQFSDEIEVLNVGNNAKILGKITRRDITYRHKEYDARLVVDNRTIVEGTATVTSINDKTVALQILGNNSNVNYLNKFNNVYIDEMDLGYACNGHTATISSNRGGHTTVTTYTWNKDYISIVTGSTETRSTKDDVSVFDTSARQLSQSDIKTKLMGPSTSKKFVCLPALSSNGVQLPTSFKDTKAFFETRTDVSINDYIRRMDRNYNWIADKPIEYGPTYWEPEERGSGDQWTQSALSDHVDGDVNYIIPQPYMWYVVERFVQELGYVLQYNGLRIDWLKGVYLVNTTYTTLIQNMLPHWTAAKFMTEIERFYGVVFWFDSKAKTCYIRKRSGAFSDSVRFSKVDDSYSSDVSDEDTTDISNANVTIDYGDDPLNHFDDTITKNAKEVECQYMSGVNAFFAQSQADDGTPIESCVALRRASNNTNEQCRKYILYNGSVTQCDQMGDLVRGSDNDEIELGIIPAQTKWHESYIVYPRAHTTGTADVIYKSDKPIMSRCPVGESMPLRNDCLNIGKYIDGDDSIVENNTDKMRVALWDGNTSRPMYYLGDDSHIQELTSNELMGWIMENDDKYLLGFYAKNDTLQLTGEKSINTLRKNWDTEPIDTTVAYTMTLYTDMQLDLRKVFVIDGHRYACKSAKYIIVNNGFNKKVECTLYKFL